jgi:hypothetical protein
MYLRMETQQVFAREFGPVLYARGDMAGRAGYRVLFYSAREVVCTLDGQPVAGTVVADTAQGRFWVFDFDVEKSAATASHHYDINGTGYEFSVPGAGDSLRIAYVSCNGAETESAFNKPLPGRNALWEHLEDTHCEQKFHLLVQGGDQLYADSVWRDIPFLAAYKTLPKRQQYKAPLPGDVYAQIRDYYFAYYMNHWAQPHVRSVMARVPSVMIWDDHDIFDGWGSWAFKHQQSPVYQGIFRAAREAFFLFQRGMAAPADAQTAGMAITLGPAAIVVPDLRSERTRKQVMGAAGWRWLEQALGGLAGDRKHLVFISSVPLATSHFSLLDPILTGFPSFIARLLPQKINPKQFADDIHDQWRIPAHRVEWLRLLYALLDTADRTDMQVTSLSGEIHLGARSTIRRGARVIHQFIASGIAHKPASPFVVWCCEWLSKGVQDIDRNIDIRMEHMNAQRKRRYLRARNWLALELRADGGIHACWHAENAEPVVFSAS